MKTNTYPAWVLRHKTPGTEIRHFKGRYYLYKISSFWDKEQKKSRKKTESLIGRITEQGLIASKARLSKQLGSISVLECGMSAYLHEQNTDLYKALIANFPDYGSTLFLLALFRLGYQSPLKNMSFYYDNSYIKELVPKVNLNKNQLTAVLKEVGSQRETISKCLRSLLAEVSYVLIDQTHVISLSEQMSCNRLGYNSQRSFDPQVNLLFLFSPDKKLPLYYRMLAGDIRETKALKMTIEESGLKEAIIIGDKGFYSQSNRQNLENEDLSYILPLRRNHSLCDYGCIEKGGKRQFTDYFLFEDRVIWYKTYEKDGQSMMLCLDERLKNQEEKDYLARIKIKEHLVATPTETISNDIKPAPKTPQTVPKDSHPSSEIEQRDEDMSNISSETQKNKPLNEQKIGIEDRSMPTYTLAKFHERQVTMGTITLTYKLKTPLSPEKIFSYFKSRNEIEGTFDAYKNILDADRTYMQGQAQMETWSFINFLALIMYYRVYQQLVEQKMIKQYSPKDILMFLNHIKKIKINNQWVQAEITQKTQKIIDLLRIKGS